MRSLLCAYVCAFIPLQHSPTTRRSLSIIIIYPTNRQTTPKLKTSSCSATTRNTNQCLPEVRTNNFRYLFHLVCVQGELLSAIVISDHQRTTRARCVSLFLIRILHASCSLLMMMLKEREREREREREHRSAIPAILGAIRPRPGDRTARYHYADASARAGAKRSPSG